MLTNGLGLIYLCLIGAISSYLTIYDRNDLLEYRNRVKNMFEFAYESYLKYAYPLDELQPLTCTGMDTWGSYSLTLIDSLDTLLIMGNHSEFERVVRLLDNKFENFDMDLDVSVFETNIRVVGGLLSAHLLSYRIGMENLDPKWPRKGPLLRLAIDLANRLLPAFQTNTGMPYGTVNLRNGVPKFETSVTCSAGVGTFLVEFGTLSRLTGNSQYEQFRMGKNATGAHVDISKVYGRDSITVRTCQNWFSKFHSGDFSLIDKQRSGSKIEVNDNKIMVLIKSVRHIWKMVALKAMYALYAHRSKLGLIGNHIDVQTGVWTAKDFGIGSSVDSFFEYLVKGSILFDRNDLFEIFKELRDRINTYSRRNNWHFWVSMSKGHVTMPIFQSLEAYWPGLLSLIGDTESAMNSLMNYFSVWKQFGFLPESYDIVQATVEHNRESYPLRPELIESLMYLYRSTNDNYLLKMGVDIFTSIESNAKTSCGYATIKNVNSHSKDNRMESFFLAETTKYLYLLFDVENFVHNSGQHANVLETGGCGRCLVNTGSFVFNTEAHPVESSLLQCCQNDYRLPSTETSMATNISCPAQSFRTSNSLYGLFCK